MKVLALSGGKDSLACLFLMRDELQSAIYVDTGYAYPETTAIIEWVSTLLPVHRVTVDRNAQQHREGIPSDVVPVEWTAVGQSMTSLKPYAIQSSFQCCYQNIARPLLDAAISLGATHLVYGQRQEEGHRSTAKHGDTVDGIVRLHPIENWTRQEVLDYLDSHMTIPPHFALTHSSLDCYDCTAFQKESQDRIAWMQVAHPAFYAAYALQSNRVLAALEASL